MTVTLPASAALFVAGGARVRRIRRRLLATCIGVVALAGCGGEKTVEITDTRTGMPPGRTAPPGATTADRLGFRPAGHDAAPSGDLAYDTPAGWELLPAKQMRIAGFRVAGDANTVCTLATAGGGTLANVNRWRGQLGLGPIDEAALAALPRDTMLGRPAVLVELAGRFTGMGGDADVPDAKLLGMMVELPATSVFVKLVGTAKVVDAERERFLPFAHGVRMGGAGAGPHGAAAGGTPPAPPSSSPTAGTGTGPASVPVRWAVPDGFEQRPERTMRLATLGPRGVPEVELVLSSFPGTVGGLVANVNRWRGQMGLPADDPAAVAALPRRKMLGGEGVLVDLSGHLTDMQGKTIEGAKLLGLVFERADDTLFVKMTGPGAAVDAARAGFDAFVASLAPEAAK